MKPRRGRADDRGYEEGDKVEARYRGGSKWFPGKITRANRDGTYDIRYDDGDAEKGVEARMVRKAERDQQGARDSPRRRSHYGADAIEEGDAIEARYRGRDRWFRGRVTRKHRDGTFDIRYDDGDREQYVESRLVRKADRSGSGSRARDDSADGRSRRETPREELHQNAGKSRRSEEAGDFGEGDKIEARYRGGSRWFRGKITRANEDGTYDIRYEDGDSERAVKARMIRLAEQDKRREREASRDGSVAGDGEDSAIEEGDEVEARYKGRARWFPGKVTGKHRDGSYDIRYDDGDAERNVDGRLVRKAGRSSLKSRTRPDLSAERRSKWEDGKDQEGPDLKQQSRRRAGDFEEGDAVEARYGGGSRWFRGRISRVNRDGTFDIRYDDGDTEEDVGATLIRTVSETKSRRAGYPERPSLESIEEGDVVDARYRGRDRWFPGRITRKHPDGTFDVRYDDGDREQNVDSRLVRKGEAPGSKVRRVRDDTDEYLSRLESTKEEEEPRRTMRSRTDRRDSHDYEEGDKIEARYRGGSKWFPGKISRANHNGTFDIRYDDGDAETAVNANKIRPADRHQAARRGNARRRWSDGNHDDGMKAEIEEGDVVEARYRGRDRWFRGKITRKH
eukprot:scaffold456_cov252-Pinguiococcus_pyrenoidosus.AAC.1